MVEAQQKFFYRNRKGKKVYAPVYKKYRDYFTGDIIENSRATQAFGYLKDTSIFERYMQNVAQFSAAKSVAEGKLLQAQVFKEDDNGDKVVKDWNTFKNDAGMVSNIVNEVWLRVERESCVRGAVMGQQFSRYMEDVDLYPYWVWRGVMDDREREEHVAMEGKVFKIGDPDGDACFPPDDFNCRCDGENCDDDYLTEHNLTVSSNTEAKSYLNNNVGEDFRFNPAVQGALPNTGSYFEAVGSANDITAGDYGDLEDQGSDEELEGLSAKFIAFSGLTYMVEKVNDWRKKYKVNRKGDLVFQNKRLLSNVRFVGNSLNAIQKHSRGFDNLPKAITNPDEVWGTWENVRTQRVVLRNYILFGKTNYVVKTRDGVITDAFAVPKGSINKFRKGALL